MRTRTRRSTGGQLGDSEPSPIDVTGDVRLIVLGEEPRGDDDRRDEHDGGHDEMHRHRHIPEDHCRSDERSGHRAEAEAGVEA